MTIHDEPQTSLWYWLLETIFLNQNLNVFVANIPICEARVILENSKTNKIWAKGLLYKQ